MTKNKIIKTKDNNVQTINVGGNNFTEIKSIEKLWGVEKPKYNHKNLKSYKSFLNNLTDFELENYAINFNVRFLDRAEAAEKLCILFNRETVRISKKTENIQVISQDLNKKLIELLNS